MSMFEGLLGGDVICWRLSVETPTTILSKDVGLVSEVEGEITTTGLLVLDVTPPLTISILFLSFGIVEVSCCFFNDVGVNKKWTLLFIS